MCTVCLCGLGLLVGRLMAGSSLGNIERVDDCFLPLLSLVKRVPHGSIRSWLSPSFRERGPGRGLQALRSAKVSSGPVDSCWAIPYAGRRWV